MIPEGKEEIFYDILMEPEIGKEKDFYKTQKIIEQCRELFWSDNDIILEMNEQTKNENDITIADLLVQWFDSKDRDENISLSEIEWTHHEILWFEDLIEMAMHKLYSMSEYGKVYYEIIRKLYLDEVPVSDEEIYKIHGIERSAFSNIKERSIEEFSVCFWSRFLSEIDILEDMNELYSNGYLSTIRAMVDFRRTTVKNS